MSRLLLLRHIINTFNKKEHTHEDVAKYILMSKTNIFILDVGSKQSRHEHQYDDNVFKVMTQACCYWLKPAKFKHYGNQASCRRPAAVGPRMCRRLRHLHNNVLA
jgi:hypothetical protein